MNYCYEIVPEDCIKLLRNCSGCGCEKRFVTTGKFRVNANGSRLDVWLVYQCEKCRHTYNIAIYERVNKAIIPPGEYEGFLSNDEELALKYGMDRLLMERNRAKIDDRELKYRIVRTQTEGEEDALLIKNPYNIKVREDKLLAEILGLPRNQVKKLLEKGELTVVLRR